ncbi:transcriptional regulator GcvA [Bosea sp. 2RAB26]|uniref:transcriptional regulator GcvA n=1 Tax=Bosea sp. 2RAB26 TaxID=3237476 RepID=UPI003F93BE5F
MKTDRLPPLNALRAFEATARHLSVKEAADELCVTPGAVSQMLKALELHFGTQLFRRINRGMALTPAGQSLMPPVRNAFRQIAEASRRIDADPGTGPLTISTTPFFASAWLVPRLKQFHAAHPDIDLRVVTGTALVDFVRDGVDVAVRHGFGHYPGLRSELLVAVEVVPVAAPALLASLGRPQDAACLARWPHVHDSERKAWQSWFQAQGVEEFSAPRGPSFDDSGLMLKAVLSGQGAGLLPAAMIETDIAEGRLVQLANVALLEDFAYFLVFPDTGRARPGVAAFCAWMREVAAAYRQAA